MNVLTIEQLDVMAAQIEATKLSLVTREQSRDIFEQAKEHFILAHQEEWKEIGNSFREKREACGLTQEHVARALGVSASKISNFENGKSIVHARLMAKAYTRDWFYFL